MDLLRDIVLGIKVLTNTFIALINYIDFDQEDKELISSNKINQRLIELYLNAEKVISESKDRRYLND